MVEQELSGASERGDPEEPKDRVLAVPGDAGVEVTATDDRSWTHAITFPASVLELDAEHALRQLEPQVVECSWPPPDNDFERAVSATESVETRIVISSRHRFASGDWAAYETQQECSFGEDRALSKLVLLPAIESAVYVFRRQPAPTRGQRRRG